MESVCALTVACVPRTGSRRRSLEERRGRHACQSNKNFPEHLRDACWGNGAASLTPYIAAIQKPLCADIVFYDTNVFPILTFPSL